MLTEEEERMIKEFRETPLQFIRHSPKPIVVIRIPDKYFGGSLDQTERARLMKYFEENRKDYYWFVLPQNDPTEDVQFEVFYEKDHQPISNEELKQLITDSITPPTQP